MNNSRNIADIRRDYKLESLLEKDVKQNPLDQFSDWWNEAMNSEIDEVNAMTLATSTKDGKPSARIVLLKGFTQEGFIFFTNYESRKGTEIAANAYAALVFFWKELERQIRIEGTIKKISESDSDEYFTSRPEGSKIGAWASPQSAKIEGRNVIEENVEKYKAKFDLGNIERPPHWGGFIIEPSLIEFWQGRSNRLHDRIQYSLLQNVWRTERLAP